MNDDIIKAEFDKLAGLVAGGFERVEARVTDVELAVEKLDDRLSFVERKLDNRFDLLERMMHEGRRSDHISIQELDVRVKRLEDAPKAA